MLKPCLHQAVWFISVCYTSERFAFPLAKVYQKTPFHTVLFFSYPSVEGLGTLQCFDSTFQYQIRWLVLCTLKWYADQTRGELFICLDYKVNEKMLTGANSCIIGAEHFFKKFVSFSLKHWTSSEDFAWCYFTEAHWHWCSHWCHELNNADVRSCLLVV